MWLKSLMGALTLLAGAFCSVHAAAPHVDESIDPDKSFFADHVHYLFPHQFAKVADGQGRQWEVAYADLFSGDPSAKSRAPTLVMLHGRAMNSGYWGQLLDKPLAAGWRIVTIDWSHTGKSLPRNLDLPVNRSFNDVRQIVFNLVVKHLGIDKANYLGHSMGGQIAAGYALQYPQHVERLVLYGSGGLESMQPISLGGLRLDDPGLVGNPEKFQAAWEKLRNFITMGRTQEEVEKSFYTARPGVMPYLKRGNALGDFIVASRAGLLRANPRERDRFMQAYAWDSIAAILETRAEDDDALNKRISKLKVPTLLAFGLKESAVPVPGSGNANLVTDVVYPFYTMARLYKAPVQIKLYENAGHFIHTDLPGQFSDDVLAFLQTGKAAEPLYAGDSGRYLPPPRTALTELPEDVQRFKTRYEQAFLSRDIAAVGAMWLPDFKDNGRSRADALNFVDTFLSAVSRWNLVVYSIERTDDRLVMDIETQHTFGNTASTIVLKQKDGEWHLYGNQQ